MGLTGHPLTLAYYRMPAVTNRRFASFDLGAFDRLHLPPALTGLLDAEPDGTTRFIEDDNRGAVSPEPVARLDGTEFYLSVKGVGTTVDPYAHASLELPSVIDLARDDDVRDRLARPRTGTPPDEPPRFLTGELWQRGSPYGGQGLGHASIALAVSERADLTSLAGFRIAPVVKVVRFPTLLEERLRSVRWFRAFRGAMAQEVRLVPSNTRIYFHARNSVGNDIRSVFDRYGIDSAARAAAFELEFVRSVLPMLTLFARTVRREPDSGRCAGLDFHDVWLDKDAVVAPTGAVYFVDLEGIEEVDVSPEKVREKVEDQIFRSLYEFTFAFEQIERERVRRFGGERPRAARVREMMAEAARTDPFLRVRETPHGSELEVRTTLGDEALNTVFPLVDT